MKKRHLNIIYRLILFFFVLSQFQFLPLFIKSFTVPGTNLRVKTNMLSFVHPDVIDSAGGISSASATLSNSRFSYFAKTSGTLTVNGTLITIASSGNADNNTNNIFPGDNVKIGYTNPSIVATVVDSTHFTTLAGIGTGVTANAAVTINQSGTLNVSFYTQNAIPPGGNVTVTIPANETASTNDGYPDTATSTSLNGFDLNTISSTNVTCPMGFTTATVNVGSGGTDHTIVCAWGHATNNLPGGASLTVIVGNTSKGIVNPAPVGTTHIRGVADPYVVNVKSKTSPGDIIDEVDTEVSPIDGVFISATVDDTLSFSVVGIPSGSAICNGTTSVSTTAYSIPWGIIASGTTYTAGQKISVATNALTGYSVTIEESDQMGKDGNVCTSTTPSAGNYTFGTSTCIRDTLCGGTCNESTSQDWTDYSTYPGLGFSLENQTSSDAVFTYNQSGSFYSRQIADTHPTQGGETRQNIMYRITPTGSSVVNICYRLYAPSIQPAGFYFNTVRYTVTPVF